MVAPRKPLASDAEVRFNPKCNDLRRITFTASGPPAATVAAQGMQRFTEYRIATGQLEPPEEG